MTDLRKFVTLARQGKIIVEKSIVVNGNIVEGEGVLPNDDIDITAEAFNQNVFDDQMDWNTALEQVKAIK